MSLLSIFLRGSFLLRRQHNIATAKNKARTAKQPMMMPTMIPAVTLLSLGFASGEAVVEEEDVGVELGVVFEVVCDVATAAAAFKLM